MAAFVPDRVDGEFPTRADVASVVSAAAASVFRAEQQSETGGTVSVFRGVGTAEGDMFGFGLLDGTHVVHAVFFTSVPQPAGPADRRSGRRPDDQGSPIETGHGGTGGAKSGDPPPDSGTEAK